MIARMKDAVLPPDSGVDVGGLVLPVVPEGPYRMPPDNVPTKPDKK